MSNSKPPAKPRFAHSPHSVMSWGFTNEETMNQGLARRSALSCSTRLLACWAKPASRPWAFSADEPLLSGDLPWGSGPIQPEKPKWPSRSAAR
jgi:hypothetical protein